MVAHIKQFILFLVDGKKPDDPWSQVFTKVNPQEFDAARSLPVILDEFNRLDPNDFDPIARAEFLRIKTWISILAPDAKTIHGGSVQYFSHFH